MVRVRVLLAASLAALALAGCGEATKEGAHSKLRERAAKLQGDVAADPRDIATRVRLARVQIALGDGVGTEATVKAALAAGANADYLRPLLARAYALQGNGTRALETLADGPVAPEMAGEAAWVEGDVQLAGGDLGAARAAFDRAVRALPNESALWVSVARFRDANADAAGAHDAADYAIELDAKNSAALTLKAKLVRTQQGLKPSLGWYEAALAADPANADALIEQGATFGDLGRYKDMLASLRAAAELAPGDPRIYYLQAVLAARGANYPLARSLLQRTRGAMDDVPGFMLLSAVVELELGGQAVAATWADRLLTDQPNNFTARRILAVADWADGDAGAAADALAPVAARGDADSWALLLAARLAAETGDADASAAYLARAATLARGEAAPFAASDSYGLASLSADGDPLNPAKAIPAISADLAGSNYAGAIARATRLRDANPGVADAHVLLGDAALAGGRLDLAVQAYRSAQALDASERVALRLANALYRIGDAAASRRVVLRLLANDPSSVAGERIAAALAMDARDWDSAIAHYERIRRRIGNRDAVVLRELARAWIARGDSEQALPMIALAYRLQPLNAEIMRIYADLLDRRGNAQAATDLRDKAAQIGR
ncbi:tetratricopeptide repeat protein [Sphingopyxis sp.]|uniref:tetratricopeptide repeat protein n=1 Tax=Sphingopyxis sp. TaxID=1908224 RepID=UPI0035ADDE1B